MFAVGKRVGYGRDVILEKKYDCAVFLAITIVSARVARLWIEDDGGPSLCNTISVSMLRYTSAVASTTNKNNSETVQEIRFNGRSQEK